MMSDKCSFRDILSSNGKKLDRPLTADELYALKKKREESKSTFEIR